MSKSKIAMILVIVMTFVVIPFSVFATDNVVSTAVVQDSFKGAMKFDGKDGNVNGDFKANGCDGVIYALNGSKVSIDGGNIFGEVCTDEGCGYSMAVWAKGEGTEITINGGTFKHASDGSDHCDLIYASNNAKIYIKGGTFESVTPKWTLNAKDNSGAEIIVSGGRFYKFNPAKANTEIAPAGTVEVRLENGCNVVKDGDWYVVEKVNEPKVFSNVTATINEDVRANGCDAAILAQSNAKLTINGGNIHGQLCPDEGCGFSMAVWAKGEGTEITINNGNFTHDSDGSDHCDLIYASSKAKIFINGGTFKSVTPKWTLNAKDNSGSEIIVSGGKFYKFDPAKANADIAPAGTVEVRIADGYKSVQNGDWYEVVCAHTLRKEVAEVASTYQAAGTKAHYECKNCGKKFLTETIETEATAAELVIPPMIQVVGTKEEVSADAINNALTETGENAIVVIPSISEKVTEVKLPVASINGVAGADKGLELTTAGTTITIDNKALNEIAKQSSSATDITISVKKIEEKSLTETQKSVIENKDVAFVFTAEMFADGNEISKFGGGKVKVSIPFVPETNTNASDYKVFYIADDGSMEEVLTTYVDGKIVIELEHFSEYALINVNKVVSTQNATVSGASTSTPAPAPVKDNTPKTGAVSIVAVLIIVASIGYVLTKKK